MCETKAAVKLAIKGIRPFSKNFLTGFHGGISGKKEPPEATLLISLREHTIIRPFYGAFSMAKHLPTSPLI
jgi:hypothetical protein